MLQSQRHSDDVIRRWRSMGTGVGTHSAAVSMDAQDDATDFEMAKI